MAGRQAEAKHELTALFSRETGQKDKAQSVRAMYIETTRNKISAVAETMHQTRDCEHVLSSKMINLSRHLIPPTPNNQNGSKSL